MGEGLTRREIPSGQVTRRWADGFVDRAVSGLPLDGSRFLTIALSYPEDAIEGLGRVCDELGVEPQIANMFQFTSERQREEFIRRLSAQAEAQQS